MNIKRNVIVEVHRLLLDHYETEQVMIPRSKSGQLFPGKDPIRFKKFIDLGRALKTVDRCLNADQGNRRQLENEQGVFGFYEKRG